MLTFRSKHHCVKAQHKADVMVLTHWADVCLHDLRFALSLALEVLFKLTDRVLTSLNFLKRLHFSSPLSTRMKDKRGHVNICAFYMCLIYLGTCFGVICVWVLVSACLWCERSEPPCWSAARPIDVWSSGWKEGRRVSQLPVFSLSVWLPLWKPNEVIILHKLVSFTFWYLLICLLILRLHPCNGSFSILSSL